MVLNLLSQKYHKHAGFSIGAHMLWKFCINYHVQSHCLIVLKISVKTTSLMDFHNDSDYHSQYWPMSKCGRTQIFKLLLISEVQSALSASAKIFLQVSFSSLSLARLKPMVWLPKGVQLIPVPAAVHGIHWQLRKLELTELELELQHKNRRVTWTFLSHHQKL
jgi:hypothetical protein